MTQEEHIQQQAQLARFTQFKQLAAQRIKSHAPLMSDAQAAEVARVALLSWQDMRDMWEWQEAPTFIEMWK